MLREPRPLLLGLGRRHLLPGGQAVVLQQRLLCGTVLRRRALGLLRRQRHLLRILVVRGRHQLLHSGRDMLRGWVLLEGQHVLQWRHPW